MCRQLEPQGAVAGTGAATNSAAADLITPQQQQRPPPAQHTGGRLQPAAFAAFMAHDLQHKTAAAATLGKGPMTVAAAVVSEHVEMPGPVADPAAEISAQDSGSRQQAAVGAVKEKGKPASAQAVHTEKSAAAPAAAPQAPMGVAPNNSAQQATSNHARGVPEWASLFGFCCFCRLLLWSQHYQRQHFQQQHSQNKHPQQQQLQQARRKKRDRDDQDAAVALDGLEPAAAGTHTLQAKRRKDCNNC